MKTLYHCGRIIQTADADFYIRVNPLAFEVVRCRGGFRPVDKARWGGSLPIRA